MRKSSVELLKVIAIVLIVINHVTMTLEALGVDKFISAYDNGSLEYAATSPQVFMLMVFRTFGAWGNALFFCCSAYYFFRNKNCFNITKELRLLAESWTISIICLISYMVLINRHIGLSFIIKSLLPNFFCNNWYITCYLLFYPIHPLLNRLIDNLTRKEHLSVALFGFILYYCLGYLKEDSFFASRLVQWVVLYIILAYPWKYMPNTCKDRTINMWLLFTSSLSSGAVLLAYNALSLRFAMLDGHVSHWFTNANPFIVVGAFASMNLCVTGLMKSNFINRISRHSLYVYLLHENLLFRVVPRRMFVMSISALFGISSPVVLVLLCTFFLLCICCVCSRLVMLLTDSPIEGVSKRLASMIEERVNRMYVLLE